MNAVTGTILPNRCVEHIDRALLDEQGRLRALFPAAIFQAFNAIDLKLWCYQRARYCLPTTELVQCLRELIGGRTALEIGSGNGDLGYLMGIRETDSYIQQSPEVSLLFRAMGQPGTAPPPSVEKLDALNAIKRYRPQVVIAAWFTRKFEEGKDLEGIAQASIYGAREEEILQQVETYIHVGNIAQHGRKTLLAVPHGTIHVEGLLSRAIDPTTNVIHLWNHTK